MTSPEAAFDGLLPEIALDGTQPPAEFIVSFLIWVPPLAGEAGRYLLQLRDDKTGLPIRDHWAFFGGHVEPGETGEQALLRELEEELAFRPRRFRWYCETISALPRHKARVVRKAFYLVPVTAEDVSGMVLGEGAEMRLFTVDEMLRLPNVAPWDLSVVLTHARQPMLFRPGD